MFPNTERTMLKHHPKAKTTAAPINTAEGADPQLSLPFQPTEIEDGFDCDANRGPFDDGLREHGSDSRRSNKRLLNG